MFAGGRCKIRERFRLQETQYAPLNCVACAVNAEYRAVLPLGDGGYATDGLAMQNLVGNPAQREAIAGHKGNALRQSGKPCRQPTHVIREKTLRDWNRALGGGSRVKLHAIGFFFESPDVGAFLWALARENDGSFVGMSRP